MVSKHDTANASEFLLVGIGASAGGVAALQQLFATIPENSNMAYAVVLHLSQQHESSLDAILQGKTKMPVLQVLGATKVQPNHVYVIPPGKFLELVDGIIRLREPDHVAGKRVAIDHFFRTLAEAYRERAVGIVLSGTGTDGTLGVKHIKERNGFVIVQEPKEAAFDAMPLSAIETGLIDIVLPVARMAQKLLAVRDSTRKFRLVSKNDDEITEHIQGSEALLDIITLLRIRTGNDFSNYKQPTILRRMTRHLQIHGLDNVSDYLDLLREHPEEIDLLLSNLLINVTNFFRDREAFETLEKQIIPQLFEGKGPHDTVRIWVAGCASGEEAYSIAMLLTEYAEQISSPAKIQIFASDVDADAISEARAGLYGASIALDVSEKRLARFFTKEGDSYRIRKSTREMILFAPHNLQRDPPFSRVDLISCRNVLIYLNRPTQDKVLQLFHFALQGKGYLFLGSSETTGNNAQLFLPLDKKYRIYASVRSETRVYAAVLPSLERTPHALGAESFGSPSGKVFSYADLHVRLRERYTLPSALLNDDLDVVHLSEHAGRYLRHAKGEPSTNLLKLLHPDLRSEVRAALFAAQREASTVEVHNVRVMLDHQERYLNLFVHRIDAPESVRGFLLLLFDERAQPRTTASTPGTSERQVSGENALEEVVQRLEEELRSTKSLLRNTVEQYETSLEELKSSNEEQHAINEELRSASEELETSKEELQSVNEELTTVNHELKETLEEVSGAKADLQNLMASTSIATIFLDRRMHIKRFTPEAQKLFNVIGTDIGRPLAHLTHNLETHPLIEDAQHVLQTLQAHEREVRAADGSWYLARTLPYRTVDDRIDGVVLTFIDITPRKLFEDQLNASKERLQLLQECVSDYAIFTMDMNGMIDTWNTGAQRIFGYSEKEAVGQSAALVFTPEDLAHGAFDEEMQTALREGRAIDERWHLRKDGTRFYVSGVMTVLRDSNLRGFVKVARDLTQRNEWEATLQASAESLRDADRRKNEFLATLAHELRNPLTPIRAALHILNGGTDTEQQQRAGQIIERQLRRMVVLVDDLLEVSRITRGKIVLDRQHILLSEVIDDAIETTQPLMDNAGHTFLVRTPKEPMYLDADIHRVSQCVINVLNNAIKYTHDGGVVRLTVEKEDSQCVIRIDDNGIGIPPDCLESIFEIFIQLEKPEKKMQNGLGIGLRLVRTLIEMHGGTVTARSEGPDKGSEFVLRLPLAEKQWEVETPPPLRATDPSDGERRRVLVIEDDVDIAEMLCAVLEMKGYVVQHSHTGQGGIAMAASFAPDAVLIDIGLPDLDGHEVGQQLRALYPSLQLIAHSGWGAEADKARSKHAGFNHHLVKPAEIGHITALLNRVVS